MSKDAMTPAETVARLERIAAHIEGLPDEQFDMGWYRTEMECGTTMCIAGWAATLFPEGVRWAHRSVPIVGACDETSPEGVAVLVPICGVTLDESRSICSANAPHQRRPAAVAAIRALADKYREGA